MLLTDQIFFYSKFNVSKEIFSNLELNSLQILKTKIIWNVSQ